jgi:pyruvate kinase
MCRHVTSAVVAGRVLLLDDGKLHDVFEVVELTDDRVRARAAYLFEIGEEMRVRIERDGTVREATAHVRAHSGGITELALSELGEARRMVSG